MDAATGAMRWSAEANGWVVSHPVTDGSVVAAASLGERFITADPETGRRLLVFYSGTPVAGGPIMADGRAFFVTNRGGVWAVDPSAISRPFSRFAYVAKFNFFAWRLRSDPPRQTGALWVASAGGKVKYSPAYSKGSLLVVNESGQVTAFNEADGSTRWETQLGGEIVADPVVAGDTLVLGTVDGALHGLDVETGSLEWTHDHGKPSHVRRAVRVRCAPCLCPRLKASSPRCRADETRTGPVDARFSRAYTRRKIPKGAGVHLPKMTQATPHQRDLAGESWDPGQYLKFADHRLRPALDLMGRIPLERPQVIYDLGCGSGNVTRLLADRWRQA